MGVGTSPGEHGVVQGDGLSAVFMSRGLYVPYVLYWDVSGNQGTYYEGYPTGNSYPVGGGIYRMDFQAGYALYNTNNSLSSWYISGVLQHQWTYCD